MPFNADLSRRLALRLLALALLAIPLAQAFANEPVGKLVMAIGRVEIARGGEILQAKKDTELLSGDLVSTASTSNAQIRFKDGSLVALRSDTEFEVNEYKFSGKADGTEKATFSVLKGGVRAVTGAIGRGNRENLKVNAVVATVGIRGTGFNVTFCSAACKAANPNAKEGLYAGVLEGKIAISNKAGSTSDLGVNRFVYVAAADVLPQSLIAPPTFLKDSLDSQLRVKGKVKELNLNSESGINSANAVQKAPAEPKSISSPVEAPIVNIEPPIVRDLRNLTFFEGRAGNGDYGNPAAPGAPDYFIRAAEAKYDNPTTVANCVVGGVAGECRKITLNQVSANPYATVDGAYAFSVIYGNALVYNRGSASSYESGRDGGVIAWGRWAGGTVDIGGYGAFDLQEHQGWHYIYGIPAQSVPLSQTFNLDAGTRPTEVTGSSDSVWRLTGGRVTVTAAQGLDGLLNLYLLRSTGYATFDMTWRGSWTTASGLNNFTSTVSKTSGTVNICTTGCEGSVALGFYGNTTATHVGVTYQFNTASTANPGGSYVQGVAIFK